MEEIQQLGDKELGELAAIIRHYRKAGPWKDSFGGLPTAIRANEILVKNTETSAIPAYACMQIDGVVTEGPDDDKRTYIKVKKPTGTTGSYLFNGHYEIEASGYGVGLDGPHVRAYKNSGTVTLGDRWAPTSGQWYLTATAGGQFTALGEDGIASNVFRVLIVPAFVEITVVTDVRIDGTSFEKKTRVVKVLAAEAESAWTSWHEGTVCP